MKEHNGDKFAWMTPEHEKALSEVGVEDPKKDNVPKHILKKLWDDADTPEHKKWINNMIDNLVMEGRAEALQQQEHDW